MLFPPSRCGYSRGFVLIALIAVASTLALVLWRVPQSEGMQFWVFARQYFIAYQPEVAEWNRENPERAVAMQLLQFTALERRLLSALRADTPVADCLEVERSVVGETFAGPLEDIGFVDLTERLAAGGWLERFNPPSFSPWTTRGRIFGLPHDVHPVLLAYRADLVEAAGIDVSKIETWEDFAREMAPLMAELGRDGRPLHYLLSYWPTNVDQTEILLLQAGGSFFDDRGQPALDTAVNARVMAQLAAWSVGPGRLAIDAQEMTAAGNRIRIDGTVVCTLMSDWLTGAWRADLPRLAGKMKLMPIPAWERGGRRTSVYGGTSLMIPQRTHDVDAAFAFALHLYTSPEVCDAFFREAGVIPPFRDLWARPVFDEPSPYFCGQPIGRMFIEQAPAVPRRSSSPFTVEARRSYCTALQRLVAWANSTGTYDRATLEAKAPELLAGAQAEMVRRVQRNAFLREEAPRP